MATRRVLLIDPWRFTRSALSQFLQRRGLIVDAREVESDDVGNDQRVAMIVVRPPYESPSLVTLRRHGQQPVTLNRSALTLGIILDFLEGGQPAESYVRPEVESSVVARLSDREREVLSAVAQGENSRMIAARLGIQPKTVDHHKASIYRKLNVRNQAQAVAAAVRAGLVHG